tara:strand:- start:1067 stop:2065 length:999 start_codon:yes stop_codon:yes gene_type:complete
MNAQSALLTLTAVVLVLLLWQLRWVLLVLFGAVVLAVALDVLIHQLQLRFRLDRPRALVVVLAILLLAGVVIGQLLLPELITQVQQLGRDLPQLIRKLSGLLGQDPRLASINQALSPGLNAESLQSLGRQLLDVAGGAANSMIQVLLAMLLGVLLVLDPASHRRMVLAITPRPARDLMLELLDESRQALGGWLTGMTLSATTVFLLTWGGLALLQAPLPLLSGLVCGLLTFIPTIGPTAATVLPVGLALLQSSQLLVSVLIFRLVLQNLEAFLLTPLLLRKTVNLLPTVALMAQLSLGALLGLPGVLLALPLVVVMQVLMHRVVVERVMDRW